MKGNEQFDDPSQSIKVSFTFLSELKNCVLKVFQRILPSQHSMQGEEDIPDPMQIPNHVLYYYLMKLTKNYDTRIR